MTENRIAPTILKAPLFPTIPSSEITPKHVMLNRRQWLAGASVGAGLAMLPAAAQAKQVIEPLTAKANPAFKPSDPPTDKKLATTYNNYYPPENVPNAI